MCDGKDNDLKFSNKKLSMEKKGVKKERKGLKRSAFI